MSGRGADYHPRTGGAFAPPLYRDVRIVTAAPVQNTWYTVFEGTNVVVYDIHTLVMDVGETIALQLTIDGLTRSCPGVISVAGTNYRLTRNLADSIIDIFTLIIRGDQKEHGVLFWARALKVEIRKTTAAGAGNLTGRIYYGQY